MATALPVGSESSTAATSAAGVNEPPKLTEEARAAANNDEGKGPPSGKDIWDKIDILFKPVGALLVAGLTAYLGVLASDYLDRQQRLAASVNLYAQLMSSREAADSALRKEMFNTTLNAFLTSTHDSSAREKVIKLDLLARNFHNSLDLAPLFEHLYSELSAKGLENEPLRRRVESLASKVNQQQLAALESVGAKRDSTINLDENKQVPPEGIQALDSVTLALRGGEQPRRFSVDVLRVDIKQKTIRVRLTVRGNNSDDELDSVLDVGIFDFPMIRNIPLLGGERCALVVTKLRDVSVEVTLIYFPGSRAALKEKPYYDEIFQKLVARQ
ncbi:MAG TPA: hypothetical protein VI670_02625 [Thermoanaerobaculia bacterium]|jgi:hypothetical protein